MTKQEFIQSSHSGLIAEWIRSKGYILITHIDPEAFTLIGKLDIVGEDLQFEFSLSYYNIRNNSIKEILHYFESQIGYWIKYTECTLCAGKPEYKDCPLCNGSRIVERKNNNAQSIKEAIDSKPQKGIIYKVTYKEIGHNFPIQEHCTWLGGVWLTIHGKEVRHDLVIEFVNTQIESN